MQIDNFFIRKDFTCTDLYNKYMVHLKLTKILLHEYFQHKVYKQSKCELQQPWYKNGFLYRQVYWPFYLMLSSDKKGLYSQKNVCA